MLNLSRIILDKQYMLNDKELYEKVIKKSLTYYAKDIINDFEYHKTTEISEYQEISISKIIENDVFMSLIKNDLYIKRENIKVNTKLKRGVYNSIGYNVYYKIKLCLSIKINLKYGINIQYSTNNYYLY